MKEPSRSRSWWLERAALAALILLFVWRGLLPAWRELNTDFPNYYLAARLFRGGYPMDRLYDWVWLQRQKDHAGITEQALVGYIPLSFFSALVVAPLASLPVLEAKHAWLVANLLLLGGTAYLFQRMTALRPVRIWLIVFLAIVPLRTNFQFGQQHLLLLSLLTLAAWLDSVERPFASGAALAVASSVKLYPGLFVFFLVRKRRWRALAGLFLTGALLAVLGWRLFGYAPLRDYVVDIIPRGLQGENNDPYGLSQSSTTALLRRLFVREPELNPHPLLDAPAVFATVQPVIQALVMVPGLWLLTPGRATDPARERLEWGSFVALLLTLSSATATYHFCVLILGVVLGADYLFRTERPRLAWALIALYAAVSAPFYRFVPESPSGWLIFAGCPRLYAVLALWLVFLYVLRGNRRMDISRDGLREAAPFVVLFVALVASGVGSNLQRVAGLDAGYASRVEHENTTILATAPSVAGDVVYFARLDVDGSTVDRTGSALSIRGVRGTELFHPAVTGASLEGWMELSSTTSKVVRFPLAATELVTSELPVEVEDAEQPVVSRDGRWLAFLREGPEGRADLHLLDRQALSARRENLVTAAPRDVLDVAFLPDDRVVLAAARGAGPRLFVGDAGASSFLEIATPEGYARYPAVSPDGEWLAYSREGRGQWQLWLRRLATGDERRLTEGDCNATLPAWMADGRTLVYATDCGRGLAHTALTRVRGLP